MHCGDFSSILFVHWYCSILVLPPWPGVLCKRGIQPETGLDASSLKMTTICLHFHASSFVVLVLEALMCTCVECVMWCFWSLLPWDNHSRQCCLPVTTQLHQSACSTVSFSTRKLHGATATNLSMNHDWDKNNKAGSDNKTVFLSGDCN